MQGLAARPEKVPGASDAVARTGDELPPTSEEAAAHLQLVERIANSEAFLKSVRLPALLRYLAHCSLSNNRAGMTEQAIGREVFGKPKDFHPTEDSSVRVYVRQLRLRLHEYYQSVGHDEPIVIEIPKGGYALSFCPRYLPVRPGEYTAAIPALPLTSLPDRSVSSSKNYIVLWIPWTLFAAALVYAAVGWYRVHTLATRELPPWPISQVIVPDKQTSMVLSDGSFVMRLLGDKEVTLDEYADHHFAEKLIPPHAGEGELRLFGYLQFAQMTSMADARAATALTSLAGSLRSNIVIHSAKEMNGSMLTNGNLILIGAKTSNPWAELFDDRLNFRLVEEGLRGARYISNRMPQKGEREAYTLTGPTGISGDDYATISLVPGMGEQGSVLLLQGLRLEGTEAAIRFLASPASRTDLEEKLKGANGGVLPQYFEALLHAHSMGGSAASVDCLAVRVVSPAKH